MENPFKGMFGLRKGASVGQIHSSARAEVLRAIGGSERYQILVASMDMLSNESGKVTSQWQPEVTRRMIAEADVSEDERVKLYAKLEDLEGRGKR